MSILEFNDSAANEYPIQVEEYYEDEINEAIDDSISYLMQPYLMLKVKGLDYLAALEKHSVFEDPELGITIFEEIKKILEQTDSPNLISSVCHSLEQINESLSYQNIAKYAYILFIALYNTLKLSHQIGYPDYLCVNILQLLRTAQLYMQRIFECNEMAYQLLEQLEDLSHIFCNLIQLSIQIFGQYSQEFTQAVSDYGATQQQYSRHITLLVQYYIAVSRLFPALLRYPFLNLSLVQKFSQNIQTCFYIADQLSDEQPLRRFLTELLSCRSIAEEVCAPENDRARIEAFFLNIIRADEAGLVGNILLSRQLAMTLLLTIARHGMAKGRPRCPDTVIACLGVVDITQLQKRSVVGDSSLAAFGRDDGGQDQYEAAFTARQESSRVLHLFFNKNLLFELIMHIQEQFSAGTELKKQPVTNTLKLAYVQFIRQLNRLKIDVMGLNLGQRLLDTFVGRNRGAAPKSFTALRPKTIQERVDENLYRTRTQHEVTNYCQTPLAKQIIHRVFSTQHLFGCLVVNYQHNCEIVKFMLQEVTKEALELMRQNRLVISDYRLHLLINFIACCDNNQYAEVFIEHGQISTLANQAKHLFQHKRNKNRYTDGDLLFYAFLYQYYKIKAEKYQLVHEEDPIVCKDELLNYYVSDFEKLNEDVPFLLRSNEEIYNACLQGGEVLEKALDVRYL